jgi:hypothetical protein
LEFLEKCAISSMQYFLKDFIFIFAFWWNKKDWKIIVFFFSFFSLRQISLVGKSSFQNLNNKCFFFCDFLSPNFQKEFQNFHILHQVLVG